MLSIGGRKIGPGYPVLVIAEIGINHNGSLEMAIELVEAAAKAGAEAVKFQKRTVPVVYTEEELRQPREFDRSILENALRRQTIEGVHYEVFPKEIPTEVAEGKMTNGMLKYALEFGEKEFDLISRRCRELGIAWSASAWDGLSVNIINGFDVPWLKVASACLTNRDLLERIGSKGKPVLLSTGGSSLSQVEQAVEILGTERLVLLHCTAEYPPADQDTNLLVMETLRRMYPQVPVGFSSHAQDIFPAVVAATLGASVIEVHLTLDRNLPGSDHKASLEPTELSELVQLIRRAETLRGDGVKRVTSGEVKTMEKLRRRCDF